MLPSRTFLSLMLALSSLSPVALADIQIKNPGPLTITEPKPGETGIIHTAVTIFNDGFPAGISDSISLPIVIGPPVAMSGDTAFDVMTGASLTSTTCTTPLPPNSGSELGMRRFY